MNRKIVAFLLGVSSLIEFPIVGYATSTSNIQGPKKSIMQQISDYTSPATLLALLGFITFQKGKNDEIKDLKRRLNDISKNSSDSFMTDNSKLSKPAIIHTDNSNLFGIHNINNSCYLNTVIQALYSSEAFRNFILENEEIILNCPDYIYSNSILRIFKAINDKDFSFTKKDLRVAILLLGHCGDQESADEYISTILNGIVRELGTCPIAVSSHIVPRSDSCNLVDLLKVIADNDMERFNQMVEEEHNNILRQKCINQIKGNLNNQEIGQYMAEHNIDESNAKNSLSEEKFGSLDDDEQQAMLEEISRLEADEVYSDAIFNVASKNLKFKYDSENISKESIKNLAKEMANIRQTCEDNQEDENYRKVEDEKNRMILEPIKNNLEMPIKSANIVDNDEGFNNNKIVTNNKREIIIPISRTASMTQKNTNSINIPEVLNLKDVNEDYEGNENYDLSFIIVHVGKGSIKSGHYIIYKKIDNRWYEISDSNIRPIANNNVLNDYVKRNCTVIGFKNNN